MPARIANGARALARLTGWSYRRTRLALRRGVCLARRLRYVPLALAATGAIMVTFGPKPRLVVEKPRTLPAMANTTSVPRCCAPAPATKLVSTRRRSRRDRSRPSR
jgi:hypothetical protein